jgi:hypothetical protein
LVTSAKATRQALLQKGIVPESLSPAEDLKTIAKRREEEKKILEKNEKNKIKKITKTLI